MRTANDRIERYAKEFRAGLVVLGAPFVGIGVWALAAPRSWYDEFPGAGMHWIPAFGPYDEHLVRDLGGLYLGLGLLLVFAAVSLARPLVQGALAMLLVFAAPHLVWHLTELDALPTGDNVVNVTTLVLSVVLPAVLLYLTFRPGAYATATTQASTPIEGGVTYGTR
jgi:hypothetical protein